MILLPETKGARVVKFIEKFCVHGEGDFFGEPFKLDQWQQAIIYEMYEIKDNGERKYREALIGLPKGNGKTALAAAIGLYELLGSGVTSPLVAVAAASYEQANLVFGTMKTMCEESIFLRDMVETFENEIQVKNAPGRAFRVAAKAGTADGGRNSCFIADEIHEWNNINLERVHYVLSNNTAKRKDGLVLNITTAGYDLDIMAGRMYQRGLLKEAKKQDDPEFYFKWIGAKDDDTPTDESVWEKVNPAITNDWWPIENLRRRHKSLPINEFQRYHLNQWTRTQEESWIEIEKWLACQDEELELEPGLDTFVGVDMALRHDSVAIVYGQKDDNEIINMMSKIWLPNDENFMDYQEIEAFIVSLMKDYKVKEVAYDPAFFERSAQVLLDRGVPMVNFPQTHSRMIPACGNAYDLIANTKVRHNGDPTFTDQVMSAAQRTTDMGWRLSKGRSKRKIDGAIAMVLMLDRITAPEPLDDEPEVSIINL
jgi:phage terminase large subunit-like protein